MKNARLIAAASIASCLLLATLLYWRTTAVALDSAHEALERIHSDRLLLHAFASNLRTQLTDLQSCAQKPLTAPPQCAALKLDAEFQPPEATQLLLDKPGLGQLAEIAALWREWISRLPPFGQGGVGDDSQPVPAHAVDNHHEFQAFVYLLRDIDDLDRMMARQAASAETAALADLRERQHSATNARNLVLLAVAAIVLAVLIRLAMIWRHRALSAQNRLQHALDYSHSGFVEIDMQTGKVFANQVFLDLWELRVDDRECMTLESIWAGFQGEEAAQHEEAFSRINHDEVSFFDYTFTRSDGDLRHYRTASIMVHNATGGDVARILVSDLTDRVRNEQALKARSAKLNQIYWIISSELRTPSANLLMQCEQLSENEPNKSALTETSRHLVNVIDDLRVSVDPIGDQRERKEVFTITDLADKAGQQLAALYARNRITLHTDLSEADTLPLYGELFLLRTVLVHLMRNIALAPGVQHTWCRISSQRFGDDHERVVITIEDDSTQPHADVVEQLVNQHADGLEGKGSSSMGFSLQTAESWIQHIGGTLIVERGESGGSLFSITVYLPHFDEGNHRPHQPADESRGRLAHRRVLLVERDDGLRKTIGRLLSDAFGFEVTSTTNDSKAIQLLETRPFGLIITDNSTSAEATTGLLAKLRNVHLRIPVVVLVDVENSSEIAMLKQAGANAIAVKPLDQRTLRDTIDSLSRQPPSSG